MLFIAQRSYTKLHPQPLDFLTSEIQYYNIKGLVQRSNEALALIIVYYWLYALIDLFTHKVLINSRQGFVDSL